jgi:hypothetical protein
MIGLLRSELYRTFALRSSWVSIAASIMLGVLFGIFDDAFWSLFAGLGSFGLAVMTTAQHYQHRTALLLFLGRPHRLLVLAAQCVAAAVVALFIALVSGISILDWGEGDKYRATLTVVPLIAVLGVAAASVVRRPLWLLGGAAGWLVFVEGLFGRLESPLPFTAFLTAASTGDDRMLLIFAAWTGAALLAAVIAIRRDLTGD